MVAELKRWMKRVSSSRFEKCRVMRVRVRVWSEEGPGLWEVLGRMRYRSGWISRGPRYSTGWSCC